jgi:hypothetical protein
VTNKGLVAEAEGISKEVCSTSCCGSCFTITGVVWSSWRSESYRTTPVRPFSRLSALRWRLGYMKEISTSDGWNCRNMRVELRKGPRRRSKTQQRANEFVFSGKYCENGIYLFESVYFTLAKTPVKDGLVSYANPEKVFMYIKATCKP